MRQHNENIGTLTRRIMRWYRQADAGQVSAGLEWYTEARQECARLERLYRGRYTLKQIAYCMAALSPQTTWEGNVQACADILHLHSRGKMAGDTLPGYNGRRVNVAKAARILSGDLDALRGPKVTVFAANILGDMSRVTVDVWATRASRPHIVNDARMYRDDEMPGAVEHRAIAEAYRRAAAIAGISPADMQAIVWVTVRDSDAWTRPQSMTQRQRVALYRRQSRARARLGLA